MRRGQTAFGVRREVGARTWCSSPLAVQWAVQSGQYSEVPRGISQVLATLRRDLDDRSISSVTRNVGWFEQGQGCWKYACSKWKRPYCELPDPFEPLGEILSDGYRVALS